VLVLTAEEIHDGSPAPKPDVVPRLLLESLQQEKRRCFAESSSADGLITEASALLKEVALDLGPSHSPEPEDGHKSQPRRAPWSSCGSVSVLRTRPSGRNPTRRPVMER